MSRKKKESSVELVRYIDTEKFKNAEEKRYNSIAALANATGIPSKMLKWCKAQDFLGFKPNNNVDWAEAKPIFIARYDEIAIGAKPGEDIAFWKLENAKKDAAIKDLKIKEMKEQMITPEEVRSLMVELATKQSVVIKQVFDELPPKLAGKNEPEIKHYLTEAVTEIFSVLQGKIENWGAAK